MTCVCILDPGPWQPRALHLGPSPAPKLSLEPWAHILEDRACGCIRVVAVEEKALVHADDPAALSEVVVEEEQVLGHTLWGTREASAIARFCPRRSTPGPTASRARIHSGNWTRGVTRGLRCEVPASDQRAQPPSTQMSSQDEEVLAGKAGPEGRPKPPASPSHTASNLRNSPPHGRGLRSAGTRELSSGFPRLAITQPPPPCQPVRRSS